VSLSADQVRQAAQALAHFLELLADSKTDRASLGPEDLTNLFVQIGRVGDILQARAGPDPDLDQALLDYRGLLEQLQQRMPYLRARLLLERARLEDQRTHLESANLWAEASRRTY
jgi:hypothetical protein